MRPLAFSPALAARRVFPGGHRGLGASALGTTPQRDRRDPEREESRVTPWFVVALALHAALVALGFRMPEAGERGGGVAAPEAVEVEIEVLVLPPAQVGEPGGGSLEPEPDGPEAAGALVASPRTVYAPVVSAPELDVPGPVAPPARVEDDPELANDSQSPVEEVAVVTTEADAAFTVDAAPKPRTARVSAVPPRLPSEPAKGAATHTAPGRSLGYGPGAYGGPGGTGRGFRERPRRGADTAAGEKPNPFGGSRGVWRGEICWLPPGTQFIRSLRECPRAGELRTDVLNVAARRFDEGFPGVGNRNEWFAIKYTGPFTVAESGAYRFRVHADDGAVLVVDGDIVVDNDGVHEPVSAYGVVELTHGEHHFELVYFQGPRFDLALQVYLKAPGRRERLFRPVN